MQNIVHAGDHAHITSGDTRNAMSKDQEEEFQKMFDLLSGEIQRSEQIAQNQLAVSKPTCFNQLFAPDP